MKNLKKLLLITAIIISMSALDGFAFKLGGKEMVKNGTGTRTKFFITVYYASLYLPQELKGKSGKEIVEADEPMSVVMKLDTSMITKEKFIKSTREGFGKSAASGYPTNKSDVFLNAFKTKIKEMKKYDVVYLQYVPKKGVIAKYKIKKTGEMKTVTVVPGLAFKKALFGIWLGANPIQSGCKKGMLGK